MKSITKQKLPFLALACASGTFLMGQNSHAQFSSTDANTLMNAYNTAFLTTSGGNSQFDNGFWGEAEEIEGVEDAYNRSGNSAYLTEITQLLNGFSATNGTNWSGDIYNDDCMWACIAYLRGYQATGNSTFLTIATANFNMVWARGWDTTAGGLYWTTADTSKNSCDEDPAAIVAYLLYKATGNSTYLTDAQNLYNWELSHLYNSSTGEISDNWANNQANGGATTYNQGTFIGAADYLGDVANATLAENYLMGSGGLLPDYGEANNNSGFNGIAIRWAAKFMKDSYLVNNYLPWLQYNANTAFRIRNTSNLSWCSWEDPTPNETLDDWSCVSSVIALQDVPASFPYTYVAAENATTNLSTPADVAFGANGNAFYQYAVAGNITFNTATFGDPDFLVAKSGYYAPFTECASENGSYTFTNPVEAAFGAQGKYLYLPATNGTITFNTNTFGGDPDVGVLKAGYYMPYTLCAVEGQSNTFSAPTDVAFGADGHYNFKTNVTGTIAFNDTTFGDPLSGVVKLGFYRPVNIPAPLGIANYSFETPSEGTSYQYNPTGGSWTFSGASGIQGNGSAWGAPTAPAGTQTAFLQSATGLTDGSITQTISLPSAGSYTLSFAAALRATPHNGTISINVLVDGTVVGSCSPTTTSSFTSYVTSPFTIATAGNHTVQFAAVGTAVDSSVFLDAIGIAGLANPSFETPNVGTGGYEPNPGGAGWTFTGDCGIQANGSAWGAPTAPAGTQTAYMQSATGATDGTISQWCFCSIGTYTISFAAALRASPNNGAISINVLVDGTLLGSYSPTTTTSFTTYTTSSFTTTTAGNHSVEFEAVGAAVDSSIFIDSVSIQ
jgi:predicted alpha-1,6-mannanase (GH76 family)